MSQAGIHHIFIQVYANGQTIYPSEILKPNLRFTRGEDPLTIMISEGHKHNIKVHAWFNIFYIWGYGPRPEDPNHPLNSNWEVFDREGNSIKSYSTRILKRMGIEGYFVSPFSQSYQRLILSLIEEVIKKYNVDGIHLDYIRFPDLEFGYDPFARTHFMRRYYVDPIDGSALDRLRIESYLIEPLYRKMLIQGLSHFVQKIKKLVHSLKPIPVSAAVKPDPLEARNKFGQDWFNWLREGKIDFVVPMCYTPNTNWILRILDNLRIREKIWIGLSAFNQEEKSLMRQVETLRRKGYHNLVIFSFEDLRKNHWLSFY